MGYLSCQFIIELRCADVVIMDNNEK